MLMHDREIANRIDDSVVRIVAGRPTVMRRARGYAPSAVPLPDGFADAPDLLAFGGELKATFCLVKDGAAILSQHRVIWRTSRPSRIIKRTCNSIPGSTITGRAFLVADMHPEYLSANSPGNAQRPRACRCSKFSIIMRTSPVACLRTAWPWMLRRCSGSRSMGWALVMTARFGAGNFCWPIIGATGGLGRSSGGDGGWRSGDPRTLAQHVCASERWIGWDKFAAGFSKLDLYRYLNTKPLPTIDRMLATGPQRAFGQFMRPAF
jgi:hydrogenase maturation protein HypF